MINEADFSALGLSEEMLAAVQAKGFETPTSIQRLTIPRLLSGENDIIAQSQTGTGKTAAFGLPMLQQIEPSKEGVQSIILVPTRELAVQAAEELLSYNRERRLSITAIYGLRSEVLLHALESKGIVVSAGSACDSKKKVGSPVLTAMGLPFSEIEGAIRFSFCRYNTVEEAKECLKALEELVPFFRKYNR